MKTFNKKGDSGQTSLLGGARVDKSDPRCEAYGTVDEASSALGLARALSRRQKVQQIVVSIQKDLIMVCAELAATAKPKKMSVTPDMVQRLESLITELESMVTMPRAFIIPGASPGSAALDLARTIIRRAERRAVQLRQDNLLHNETLLSYLNRLADLIFTLARYEEMGASG